jgi:hypothetical protein
VAETNQEVPLYERNATAEANSRQGITTEGSSFVKDFKKLNFKDDKVGKIEEFAVPKIAGAIESGQKNKYTGWIVNPALRVMENIYTRVIQPTQQGISTGLLLPAALEEKKFNIAKSFRFAQEQSKKISLGQALATTAGSNILPDAIAPTFAKSDFDIFDDVQRDKAFRDEWIGIVASGATDIAVAAAGGKLAGAATKAAAKKVVGPSRITTVEDMNLFKQKAEEAAVWGAKADGSQAPSGLAYLIDNAVKETNIARLADNPLVSGTVNPSRTANILSRIDNHRDMADYLMAERGDTSAFVRFFESKPVMADHIDDYGLNRFDPVTDFSKIGIDALSPKLTTRYQKIIDAHRATDQGFSDALDDFMSKSRIGAGIEDFTPGKFARYEALNLGIKQVKSDAKIGSLKIFGDAGNAAWKTTVYQNEWYDRAVRFIAYEGSGRPQGYINVSNPRKFEAANDLVSDLNRLRFLKGPEGARFKSDMKEKFLAAQTDTDRAKALLDVEQQVMMKLADHYSVKSVGDIRNNADAIAQIRKWHAETDGRRQTVLQFAQKNGFLADENGNINYSNFMSLSNEAQSVPMLDFRLLEIEVLRGVDRSAKGISPIKRGDLIGAKTTEISMGIGELFDAANMLFSNLNLIRVAYIPKNSMVDPLARGSMALESMELFTNAAPGLKNIVQNTSRRKELLKRYVPGTAGASARRQEKALIKEMEILQGDIQPQILAWEEAKDTLASAEKLLNDARIKADKAANRASKSKTAEAETEMFEAEHVAFKARMVYEEALVRADETTQLMQGSATLIEKHRAKLIPSATARAELAQRKLLGQEAEVLTVNGKQYNIKGLADPNQRGANAYMAEIDSAANFYSTAMQSQISARVKAAGNAFVRISRNDDKSYMNALAHIANRQIRNELDMPLGMMLKGMPDREIFNWLKTGDAGKEYVRRLSSRVGHKMSEDELIAWVSSTKDKVLKMYPSQELRNTILERPVTIEEVTTILKGRTDLLPSIDGPNIALGDITKAEKRYQKLIGAPIDAAWKVLSASENRMVRNPLFLSHTREEMTRLIANAQRAGIDVTEATVNNQIRQIAYRNALARVEQTLYSSRRLTNVMYQARYMMSFPLAFFNSQAVALRLMAKNPMNAYWYESIANAFDNFEAYEDQDGNTYKSISDVPSGTPVTVKYPMPFGDKLPSWAKDALKPYTDSRGGGLKWNPKQMEFMIADPSVSWFGSATVSDLVTNGFKLGPWEIYGEDISNFLRSQVGDDVYENSILYGGYPTAGGNLGEIALNTIKPGYLQSLLDAGAERIPFSPVANLLKLGNGDRWLDEVFIQYRVGYAEWDRNGRNGQPPTMATAARAAGNMSFIRSVLQFNMPISTQFDPVTRAATQYYSKLLEENNGDYDLAQRQMEADWGVDSLALIGSNDKNISGLSKNMTDLKFIRNNPKLMESLASINPKYTGMVSSGYDNLTSDYSSEVAAIFRELNYPGTLTKLSQKKTDVELAQDVSARRGWAEYRKATEYRDARMAEYGIKSTSQNAYQAVGIAADFEAKVGEIIKDFPGWVDDFNSRSKDFWKQTVPALETMLNDPNFRKTTYESSPKWQEIEHWLGKAKEFKSRIDVTMVSPGLVSRTKADFAQFHWEFVQAASNDFASFSALWLETMPELDPTKVVR